MEEKVKDERKFNNSVVIVGYLKENNLEEIQDKKDGCSVIRGSLTIALNDTESHKVQFYVKEDRGNQKSIAKYGKMRELLPTNTISIASFLKANPTSDFAIASNASTKLYAMARIEEYVRKENGKEVSSVTLRGFTAGIKKANDVKPFKPEARFDVHVYLEKIMPEIKDETETGRLLVTGLIPSYNGVMHRVLFIAPTENNVASYIEDHYRERETTELFGDIKSITNSVLKESQGSYFGEARGAQYETTFIRERIITGGSQDSIAEDEPNAITNEEVKKGLVERETKMLEAEKKTTTKPTPATQPKVESKNMFDNFDFSGTNDLF